VLSVCPKSLSKRAMIKQLALRGRADSVVINNEVKNIVPHQESPQEVLAADVISGAPGE